MGFDKRVVVLGGAGAAAVALLIAVRTRRPAGGDGAWALGPSAIPGAPSHVDPIALERIVSDRIRARPNVTDAPELVSIEMAGVGSDGLMDLARCNGSVTYEFRAKTASETWRTTATVVPGGMYTPVLGEGPRQAVPFPKCTPARVWAAARAAGANDDPCASIAYRRHPRYDFGQSPGWRFRGGGADLAVDDDHCAVVRSREDVVADLEAQQRAALDALVENEAKGPRTPALDAERKSLEHRTRDLQTSLLAERRKLAQAHIDDLDRRIDELGGGE